MSCFLVSFCGRDPAVAVVKKKVLQYNKYRDIVCMTVDIDTVATPHVCGYAVRHRTIVTHRTLTTEYGTLIIVFVVTVITTLKHRLNYE